MQIFNNKGLLKGVYFRHPTPGTRHGLIAVQLYGDSTLKTSFKIDADTPFDRQYQRLVDLLADYYKPGMGDPVRATMMGTQGKFLEYYGLKTRKVTYTVAVFD